MQSTISSPATPIHSIQSADPDAFADAVARFSGPCTVRPWHRRRFGADLKSLNFGPLKLARIRMREVDYSSSTSRNFVSTVVPLTSGFEVTDTGKTQYIGHNEAHVLYRDGPVRYASVDGTVLVINIGVDALNDARSRLTGARTTDHELARTELSLMAPRNAEFLRAAARLWSAAHQADSEAVPIAIGASRTEVIENFVLATSLRDAKIADTDVLPATRAGLSRAEDWISANATRPITRTELCDVSGLNVRTLTRAFERFHGLGPIAFARARRLEATQRALLAAEADAVSVTDIAFDHGFTHLGRFANEYRHAFGELPSATLHA